MRITRNALLASVTVVAVASAAAAHAQEAAALAGVTTVVVKAKHAEHGPAASPSGTNTYTVGAEAMQASTPKLSAPTKVSVWV